jgi:AcrR family transcriptional regulator
VLERIKMSRNTKDNILYNALELFNTKGESEVTLRDIASACDMSLGNLAYHYKNKSYIISALFRNMLEERKQILRKVKELPRFQTLNDQMEPLIELNYNYRFFYLDATNIERNHPTIGRLQSRYAKFLISYVHSAMEYTVATENMKPEKIKGHYIKVAEICWTLFNFSIERTLVLERSSKVNAKELRLMLWNVIYPHLTEKGFKTLRKVLVQDLESIQ